jgi:flavodoxin
MKTLGTVQGKVDFFPRGLYFVLALFIMFSMLCIKNAEVCAQENDMGKTLILYYSRTGTTKTACELLQKSLGADSTEIKDLSNRKGGWGFFTGTINSLFGMKTGIEPEHPDMSAYTNIILASPVWTGKLAPAIRTLIAKNRFDGKTVVIFTTTNVLEQEKYKEKSKAPVVAAGGRVPGYFQVAVTEKLNGKKKEKPGEQILEETRAFVPEIRKAFALSQ